MSRETIAGILHVILTPKQRGTGLFERLVITEMERTGAIEREFYPPTYYILGDRRHSQRPDGFFQYRFRGRPKALSPELMGHEVTVHAAVSEFGNGYGGFLERPQVVEVGGFAECPHHDDPYDDPKRGSSRVHCKPWHLWLDAPHDQDDGQERDR